MTGDILKEIRLSLGFTQVQMAAALGASGDRTVRKWETGERPIPPTIAKLARVLDIYNNGEKK